jgi:cell fate (sporulation/competence/biofilm development) regulator YmcA (YheA/YmcA/DUF963 family)
MERVPQIKKGQKRPVFLQNDLKPRSSQQSATSAYGYKGILDLHMVRQL